MSKCRNWGRKLGYLRSISDSMARIVRARTVATVTTGGTATLSIRTSFSIHHMLSAALLTRLSGSIEDEYSGSLPETLRTEHRAYVTGAILASVAAVEATINEIYIDAIEKNPNTCKEIDPKTIELLAELWSTIEGFPILSKFQFVLAVTGKGRFLEGANPYQDMAHLITIRNALVHYKPEWDTNQKDHKKIEDRLKSKFKLNPCSHQNDAFFPKKCLGHGCAEWAVQTSIQFIEAFYSRMGLPRT